MTFLHSLLTTVSVPAPPSVTPTGNRISWQRRRDSQHMELRCVTAEDDAPCFFSQVVFKEERYKMKRNVMGDNYPHHIFHIYPPLIFQNLLPYVIFIEAMVCVCVCVCSCCACVCMCILHVSVCV